MSPARHLGLVAAFLCVSVGLGHADPSLYHIPGDIALTEVLPDVEGIIGVDGTGHVWTTSGTRSVRCKPVDQPESEWVRADVISNGASLVPGGVNGGGTFAAALASDGSGLRIIGIRRATDSGASYAWGRATAVQLGGLTCDALRAAATPNVGWDDLGRFNVPEGAFELAEASRYDLFTDGSRWCFHDADGIGCLTAEPDEAAGYAWQRRVDATLLEAALAVDPAQSADLITGEGAPVRAWRTRASLHLPDGRLVFIAELQYVLRQGQSVFSSGWLPYLVAMDEDGSLVSLRDPAPRGDILKSARPGQPLASATHLVYEPTLNAVLAFPLIGQDFTQADGGRQTGVGALVMPLSPTSPADAAAYFSFSDAAARAFGCEPKPGNGVGTVCDDFNGFRGAYALGGGGVGLVLARGDYNFPSRYALLALSFNAGALDLDRDGLPAWDEAVAGSSDYARDTDGDGTPDGYEVVQNGTNPSDPTDDSPRIPGGIRYAISGLIQRIVPGTDFYKVIRGGSPEGPLCFDSGYCPMANAPCQPELGYCVARDRVTRVPFVAKGRHPSLPLVSAEDGSHLIRHDADGIWRISVTTGASTLAIPAADLAILGVGAETASDTRIRVVAPDMTSLWVAYLEEGAEPNFRAVFKDGDGPLRVVYDHQQARCDSGLGPCDTAWSEPTDTGAFHYPPQDLVPNAVRVAGYIAETGRLVLAVAGTWDRYLVGISADAPAIVLEDGERLSSGPGVTGLPEYFQPTGHDDYAWKGWRSVTTQGPGGPSSEIYTQSDGYRSDSGFTPFADMSGFEFNSAPAAFWGDILAVPSAAPGEAGAAWELVRYDYLAQPGDVFVLGNDKGKDMLYRSGPRGGLARAWDGPGHERDVWGLDIDANGAACVADRESRILIFMEPPTGGLTPMVTVASWAAGDIVDCDIDAEGRTAYLVADPPAIWRFDTPWSEPVMVAPLGQAPVTFVTERDGSLGVLFETDGLRARYVLRDGRELTIAEDGWRIDVDGRELMDLGNLLPGKALDWPARVRIAERPDGLLVMQLFDVAPAASTITKVTPFVVDLDAKGVWPLTDISFDGDHGVGIAVLPGGLAVDPWAPSNPGARPVPTPSWPDGPDAPTAPHPPAGGGVVAVMSSSDGGGCGGGPGRGALSLVWIVGACYAVKRRWLRGHSH